MTATPELATDKTQPAETWLSENSWSRPTWTVEQLVAAKKGRTISVVLPALNEEETVASVVETITPLLGGLVDEIIVLDSGSTDDTEIRAIAAGAKVVSRETALPEVPPNPGKGEVLWRSLAAATGDIIVFVDHVIPGLDESGIVLRHVRERMSVNPQDPRIGEMGVTCEEDHSANIGSAGHDARRQNTASPA